MSKKLLALLSILMVAVFVLAACAPAATPAPEEPPAEVAPTQVPAEPTAPPAPEAEAVTIQLWTKEGETDGGLQYVQSLTDAFTAANPNVTFEVINKEVETLREDFQTASLAGSAPDLLWTVSDHAGPFTTADLIMPVDDLFDMSKYVESVQLNGQTWAVPISSGNHLMLLFNKDLVAEAPADTDAMIEAAKAITSGETYGIVFNQTEPFWLVPWLGGFGGAVFAEDGVTPTLNTPEMVATLQFFYDLKFTHKVMPAEADYNVADTLFKEGKAGMLINGDWSLADYKTVLGDKLGVAPMPKVTATGLYPAPYTSGTYFMVPKDVAPEKMDTIKAFIEFATNLENQTAMVTTLSRLPGLVEALAIPEIAEDAVLQGSAAQMANGTPMPTVLEMRCNWDSMKPEQIKVLGDQETPENAAVAMQAAAEACITSLE